MGSNFRMLIHRSSDLLHLKLLGDFDASAAYQLINTLRKNSVNTFHIFIHTSGLRAVDPLGGDVFRRDLSRLNNQFFGNLIFTGEHASKIAPDNSQFL